MINIKYNINTIKEGGSLMSECNLVTFITLSILLYMKLLLKKRNLIVIIISLIVILSIIYFSININIEKFQQQVLYYTSDDPSKINNKNNMETYIQQTDTIINNDKQKLNNYLQEISSIFKIIHTNINDKDFYSLISNLEKIFNITMTNSDSMSSYISNSETIINRDKEELIRFIAQLEMIKIACSNPNCDNLSHSDIINIEKKLFANP
jgi:hypothetical protein